jgi:chromosome segregation ATPase
MSKMEQKIDHIDCKIDHLTDVVLGLDNKFTKKFEGLELRFDGLEARFDELEPRFDGLEHRFEGLQVQFNGLELRFNGIETSFDGVETGFVYLKQLFARLDRKVDSIEKAQSRHLSAFVESIEVQKELVSRVSSLESQHEKVFSKLDVFINKYRHQQTEIISIGSHLQRNDQRFDVLEKKVG